MEHFLAGALMAFSLVASILFLRAWRQTQDRLFMLFGLAFWLLSLERVLMELIRLRAESQAPIYLVRLVAFTLIAVAILEKNLAPPPRE